MSKPPTAGGTRQTGPPTPRLAGPSEPPCEQPHSALDCGGKWRQSRPKIVRQAPDMGHHCRRACRLHVPLARASLPRPVIKRLSILLSLKKHLKPRRRPYGDTSDDHSCKFRLTLGRLKNFCAINVVAPALTVIIICHTFVIFIITLYRYFRKHCRNRYGSNSDRFDQLCLSSIKV